MRAYERTTVRVTLPLLLCAACSADSPAGKPHPPEPVPGAIASASDERVILNSGSWRLVGEWRGAAAGEPAPAVLLLHRAAGSRGEYTALADALARRGLASLRLDLRGHGESDTLGRFEEPYAENRGLLEDTYADVDVALRWIKTQRFVAADRVAAVGASYSGEAIGEALHEGGERAAAYVMLSPGSFSADSIAAVEASGAAWLFVRTVEESEASREFVDAVFDALESRSDAAEIRVLPGAGHATRIFDTRPSLVEEIADWLAMRLGAAAATSGEPSGSSGRTQLALAGQVTVFPFSGQRPVRGSGGRVTPARLPLSR